MPIFIESVDLARIDTFARLCSAEFALAIACWAMIFEGFLLETPSVLIGSETAGVHVEEDEVRAGTVLRGILSWCSTKRTTRGATMAKTHW